VPGPACRFEPLQLVLELGHVREVVARDDFVQPRRPLVRAGGPLRTSTRPISEHAFFRVIEKEEAKEAEEEAEEEEEAEAEAEEAEKEEGAEEEPGEEAYRHADSVRRKTTSGECVPFMSHEEIERLPSRALAPRHNRTHPPTPGGRSGDRGESGGARGPERECRGRRGRGARVERAKTQRPPPASSSTIWGLLADCGRGAGGGIISMSIRPPTRAPELTTPKPLLSAAVAALPPDMALASSPMVRVGVSVFSNLFLKLVKRPRPQPPHRICTYCDDESLGLGFRD